MGIIRKFLGPKSKYNKSLPYTYMAKAPIIEGEDELFSHYYVDTICSLVEYLAKNNVPVESVELYGIYLKNELKLDKSICTDSNGNWLKKPEICKAIQKHYEETGEEIYRGHSALEVCSFDDREVKGIGNLK
jgi:hypothetical protein